MNTKDIVTLLNRARSYILLPQKQTIKTASSLASDIDSMVDALINERDEKAKMQEAQVVVNTEAYLNNRARIKQDLRRMKQDIEAFLATQE